MRISAALDHDKPYPLFGAFAEAKQQGRLHFRS
jgi:hypothetical protein